MQVVAWINSLLDNVYTIRIPTERARNIVPPTATLQKCHLRSLDQRAKLECVTSAAAD